MGPALVDIGRDRMVLAPTLNQGEDLYRPPEAGVADRFRRVECIPWHIMVLAATVDTGECPHETSEVGAVHQHLGRANRIAHADLTMIAETIRLPGRESLGRDQRYRTRVMEVAEDRGIEVGTMTTAIGID